ncbi:unnamed protein product [Penicillium pancosmium]
MEHSDIDDKHGNPIHQGDYVFTRIRGGSHEGKVEEVITDEERAAEKSVKHPPKVSLTSIGLNIYIEILMKPSLKVLFKNKDGKTVAHNPGTLEIHNGDSE